MKKMILGAAVTAMAISVAVPAYAATEIFNETFEGANGNGSFGRFSPLGNVKVIRGDAYTTGGNMFTGSGDALTNHYASFGSGSATRPPFGGTLLAATIQATVGKLQRYRVSFDAGVIGASTASQFLGLSVTQPRGTGTPFSILEQEIELINSTNLNDALTNYTCEFDARGPISLSFYGSGERSDSADTLLDNVSLSAVPEMSTWGMMILGFGVVGGSARARRRKTVFAAA
jgi:hypothetical protein